MGKRNRRSRADILAKREEARDANLAALMQPMTVPLTEYRMVAEELAATTPELDTESAMQLLLALPIRLIGFDGVLRPISLHELASESAQDIDAAHRAVLEAVDAGLLTWDPERRGYELTIPGAAATAGV